MKPSLVAVLAFSLAAMAACAGDGAIPTAGTGGSTSAGGAGGGTPVLGGSGGTSVVGGSGGTPVLGGSGGTPVLGGSGGTSVLGGSGGTSVLGGSGGTSVVGGSGGTSVLGGSGGTSVLGGSGGTSVLGGSGGLSSAGGIGGASSGVDATVDVTPDATDARAVDSADAFTGDTTDAPAVDSADALAGDVGTGCTGDLETVAALWDLSCASTMCAEFARATNCGALPTMVTRVDVYKSWPSTTIRYDFSGTHGKGCYYSPAGLRGAAAWNDVPTFCNGTSRTISAGSYPTSWTPEPQPPVCERGNPNTQRFDAGPPTVPYAGCYNMVESRCYPCCPSTPTDCSDKPDGYPGYDCVPSSSDYCACRCEGGKWQCRC